MPYSHLSHEDSRFMASFRGQWRAAGWGVAGDCFMDRPYGEPDKFYAALFLPEEFDQRLNKQHENAMRNYRSIHFMPHEDSRPPRKPNNVDWEDLIDSPNFVSGFTPSEVCLRAIRKACELYPGHVPSSPAELADAAATQFGYNTEGLSSPIPEELFDDTWAEELPPGETLRDWLAREPSLRIAQSVTPIVGETFEQWQARQA